MKGDLPTNLTPVQTLLVLRLLRGIAKIEMPRDARPGDWVAKTMHGNDMVTASQVEDARQVLREIMPRAERLDGWRGSLRREVEEG